MTITGKQLNQITPALNGAYAESIAKFLNAVLPVYKMDTVDIMEEFIPNLLVECCEFTRFEEGLNYSAPRLMQVWRKRFPTLAIANQYAHQPQKLANYVYGGRMGNNTVNDGWAFRGSGVIQATGKDIVSDFTKYYNKMFGTTYTPYLMAEMMRDKVNIIMGLHFACWFFSIAKGLINYAINDNFKAVVLRINGGYNGMEDRTRYYNRAKIALRT